MDLEKRLRLLRAHRLGPRVADGRERRRHGHAVGVAARERVFQAVDAGEDTRRQHAREAYAFLVGPDHHVDGCAGLDAGVVHGADGLEAGKHAVDAVELATQGLRVQVTAGHHRREARIGACAARENVAHAVDAHAAPGRLAPADEQVTRLPIEIGERDAPDTAARGRTDAAHLHEALPEPARVDPNRFFVLHGLSPGFICEVRRPR